MIRGTTPTLESILPFDTSLIAEMYVTIAQGEKNGVGKKLVGLQLLAGAEKLEYHEDGEPCKYFTAEDMQKIIEKAMFWVSYNTTYCNALNMMIKAATSAEEVEKMSWGMEIPEEFQNEVLKDYMKKMVL